MAEDVFDYIISNSFRLWDLYTPARKTLEVNDYFSAKYYKGRRFRGIVDYFKRSGIKEKSDVNLVLGGNVKFENWSAGELNGILGTNSVTLLDKNFFLEDDPESQFINKCNFLKNKILITSSHDICRSNGADLLKFKNFYLSCDKTFFGAWDWDNHHNTHISSVYALCSDAYFPQQRAHEYELSVVSERSFFLPPSAYEWSPSFLKNNLSLILNSKREVDIFGIFNLYPGFPRRNQFISQLNNSIPSVKFIDNFDNYLSKSADEKLYEWCQAKWHWIVPTLNAVSVRAFYALISGVGVILPIEFKYFSEFENLDERDVIWYETHDVMDCARVIDLAKKKFLQSGKEGILRRHKFALQYHNIDSRLNLALDVILDSLNSEY